MGERVCYMHVGTPKTGTSAIQYALTRARAHLSQFGVEYPDFSANIEMALSGVPTAGNGQIVYRALRNDDVAHAIKIIKSHASRKKGFVLSSEGFWGLPKDTLNKFVTEIVGLGYSVKALVYFRPQVEFIVSSYLQQVKSDKISWTASIDDYVRAPTTRKGIQRRWNWLGAADRLAEVYGVDGLSVRWYPSVAGSGSSAIIKDFFGWLNVQLPKYHEEASLSNPSPNPEALRVLRAINASGFGGRHFADTFLAQASHAGLLDKRPLIESETYKMIDEQTRSSNIEMLRKYVSQDVADLYGTMRPPQTMVADNLPPLRKPVFAKMLKFAGNILEMT